MLLTTLSLVDKLFLLALVILAAVIDARSRRIPNWLVLTGFLGKILIVALATLPGTNGAPDRFFTTLNSALIGGFAVIMPLVLVAAFIAVRDARKGKEDDKPSAIGGGDIKLLFVVGMWFEPMWGWALLGLACVIALVGALIRRKGKKGFDGTFAFAPAIAVATTVILLVFSLL